jgi:asparaginyl-tRNA synthetase
MWNEQPTIRDIQKYDGQEVTLRGWVYNRTGKGKLAFIQLRDGTGVMQCVVFKGNVSPEAFDEAKELRQEASVELTGTIKADERSARGFEMDVTDLRTIGNPDADDEYPISPKEHGPDFLMNHRHLWLRSSRQHAILTIRGELIRQVRDYFDTNGFLLVDSPIFTPSACEGTTNLFETEYVDGSTAYLTQSGQLYNEAAAMAFGRVYCFGPTFRAEKSATRRHLMEFWMVEPEIAFCDLAMDMDLAEDFVCTIVQGVLENCRPELESLERDLNMLEKVVKPLPRITYTDAIALLKENGMEVEWGEDFGGDEEKEIGKHYDRPVLIHRYPAACKAFYMKNDPENPDVALCVDMIAPEDGGEIIGGGQREDDYDVLREKVAQHGLDEEDFAWYLDLRRYGSVPHAGFGLGIERTLRWITGFDHVRESIPFPRMLQRVRP